MSCTSKGKGKTQAALFVPTPTGEIPAVTVHANEAVADPAPAAAPAKAKGKTKGQKQAERSANNGKLSGGEEGFTGKRAAIIRAMKALKAVGELNGKGAEEIAAKAGLTPGDVKHYLYKENDLV